MKNIIFSTVLLMSVLVCRAQEKKAKKTPEQKAIKQTEKITKELKLNKEQQLKVKSINIEYYKKKDVLDEKIDVLEKEKDKLKKERKANIEGVLTTEQKNKKEALKKKKKKKK